MSLFLAPFSIYRPVPHYLGVLEAPKISVGKVNTTPTLPGPCPGLSASASCCPFYEQLKPRSDGGQKVTGALSALSSLGSGLVDPCG